MNKELLLALLNVVGGGAAIALACVLTGSLWPLLAALGVVLLVIGLFRIDVEKKARS